MKTGRLFVLLFCALLALSCHSRIEQKLSEIDSKLNHHPDSALAALMRIDGSRITKSKDKAYYYLLTSAALDKNYIDITNDSLINIACDYYARYGHPYNRMRAFYYQGIIRKNAMNYPAAIVSFEQAQQDAQALHDYRYQGLIHRNMGSTFHATNNIIEARNHTRAAISCFTDNQDSLYALYAIYSLAVNYFSSAEGYMRENDLDSCLFYLNRIRESHPKESLLTDVNILYAEALVIKGDSLQHAINIFNNTPDSLLTYRDLGYFSYALAQTGQLGPAQKRMDLAYRSARTASQKATLNSLLYRVDSLGGRPHEALRKVTYAMNVQDSVTRVLLQQSLSVAQKDYYQQEHRLQNSRIQRQRLAFTAACIIIVLTIVSFLLFLQNRKKMREAEWKEEMAQLAATQQRIRKGNGSLVGALFMEKVARLFGLSSKYFEARDDEEKSQSFLEYKKVARELAESPALFNELENNLNHYCSDIMSKLKKQVPGIKGSNRTIIALFFAGIPDTVVQTIMKRSSPGSLRTLRSRFRQIIKNAQAPDEALFLDMLEIEKQPGKKSKEK